MSPLLECGSHSSWRQMLVPEAFFCSPFYSACDANPWDGIIHTQGVSYLLSSHTFGTTLTDMPRDMCQGIPKPSQVDEGLCVKTLEDTLLSYLVSELFSFIVTCLSYFLSAPGVIFHLLGWSDLTFQLAVDRSQSICSSASYAHTCYC